jgi:hypothetical protein
MRLLCLKKMVLKKREDKITTISIITEERMQDSINPTTKEERESRSLSLEGEFKRKFQNSVSTFPIIYLSSARPAD